MMKLIMLKLTLTAGLTGGPTNVARNTYELPDGRRFFTVDCQVTHSFAAEISGPDARGRSFVTFIDGSGQIEGECELGTMPGRRR